MAKVIEFYIPNSFPKRVNCIAPHERGKLVEFSSRKRDQPPSGSAQWQGMGIAYIAPFAVNFASDRTGDTI